LGASEIQAAEEGYKVLTSNFRRYSYKELVKATKNFKDELGRGGSGIVYKGVLDDSREVAVKMLENVRQCEEEFQAEFRIIGRINHMNLVRIWGFCSESCHKMLVTEYIKNGSLANVLFNETILLQWRQRFNIALGVAKGLAYLHHECLEWVIHCDVKPENILLDQKLEPKIADFGLAKLLNRGGSNQNVSRVRGTIGYIAPEWISSLKITAKVDVYSYGVLLLELLLGKRVLDLAVGADEEVHKVLRELVGTLADMLDREEISSIAEVVDCRRNGQFNYTQVRTLTRLSVSCLDEDRNKRPTMESIVQKLLLADDSCSIS
jgi:serine/threonine protein kinase